MRGDGLDRRAFLELAAGALLAGGLSGCASLVTVPVEPRDGRIRLVLRHHPSLEAPGGHLRLRSAGEPADLLLLALEGGEYAALSPVCTHQGCLVEVAGARLVCPCHGSEYDRSGAVRAGPAERPLARYPVELTSAGELVIDLTAGGET